MNPEFPTTVESSVSLGVVRLEESQLIGPAHLGRVPPAQGGLGVIAVGVGIPIAKNRSLHQHSSQV